MAKNEEKPSPLEAAFRERKEKSRGAMLLIRQTLDYYWMLFEDATEAAPALGLEVEKFGSRLTPRIRFHHTKLDTYLPRLIRAGKRPAIQEKIIINNNQNSTTMAQNVKAADLIGKVIIMGTTGAKYVVKSVAEDKLICDFENPTQGMSSKDMPVPFANVQKFIADGKWTVADANEAATTDVTTEADVQEVQDIVPVVTPKKMEDGRSKTEDVPQPSAISPQTSAKVEPIKATVKPEPKPKAKTQTSAISPQTSGKYAYATYQTKKGKTGAKITGFASEDDVFYAMAAEIHASGSYERDKQGNKHYYLCFGPRYAEAAKSICKVLNSDKTVNQKVEECKLIVSQATEELATKREEWKQKREERKAKGYSSEDVAAMLRKVLAGGDVPEDIKALLAKAA